MTADLVEWLGEQLDADERYAHNAKGLLGIENAWWTWDALKARFPEMSRADAQHIERHSPARVLREINATRRLLARDGPLCTSNCDDPDNEPQDPDTNWTTTLEHHFDCAAYEAAQMLALPYADRPGYREEWRP